MPTWLLMFFARIVIRLGVSALEKSYPGIAAVIEKITGHLERGVPMDHVQKHVDLLSEFEPTGIKRD